MSIDPKDIIDLTRRDFLVSASRGVGGLAFASLLAGDGLLAADAGKNSAKTGPFAPKPPHFAAKAKQCIFIYMEGGVSQLDLFDPKPKLNELNGQKMHHGVAILSRVTLHDSGRHDWQDNGEARHVGVRLGCGIRLENVYIPAGGDIPDRTVNPKFGQKLDFIERMTRWSEKLAEPTLIVGDFNIAPLECDVWSHKALLDVVSHTPIEVDTLERLQQAPGALR